MGRWAEPLTRQTRPRIHDPYQVAVPQRALDARVAVVDLELVTRLEQLQRAAGAVAIV
jgi:hypothetical protein